jgi:hypothetical protein
LKKASVSTASAAAAPGYQGQAEARTAAAAHGKEAKSSAAGGETLSRAEFVAMISGYFHWVH